MRQIPIFIAMLALLFLSGCYPGISGRVVDGMTGKPLERALVVAQWTKEHGFGLTYHELYKIVETETDKEGNFSIDGPGSPFVEPPEMIIYKEGYIPWRNDTIFPSTDIVKGHEWKDNMTYKLDVITNDCTYEQYYGFITFGFIRMGNAPKFNDMTNRLTNNRFNKIKNHTLSDTKP